MTCHEVHAILENSPATAACAVEGNFGEHIAQCAACRLLADAYHELGSGLNTLRDSAPEFPAALDNRVLADYRKHGVSAPGPIRNPKRPKMFKPVSALAWSAALAAAMLVAGVGIEWVFPREGWGTWREQPHAVSLATSEARAETAVPPRLPMARAATAPATFRRKGRTAMSGPQKRRHVVRQPKATPAPADEQLASLPAGFTGLMYCDALSCGGAMEVVRVQLPPQELGLTPGYSGSNNLISADVFIGADGIARGMRIVQ